MNEIKLWNWNWDHRPKGGHGSGSRHAYEAGAEQRLKGLPNSESPYTRMDCIVSYNKGYRDMDMELKSGTTIICDCCGHKVRERGKEDNKEDIEYEWECSVCGCADLDITCQNHDGYVIYKCPDCGNRQTKEMLLDRFRGKEEGEKDE